MPESLQKILADAKGGKFSSVSGLSEDDIASVWDNVGTFVEKQMSNQKGVLIPNLGSFCFSQRKLDVGNNKFVLMQRPVFNISEKFAQTHGLQFTKYNVPGHIPCPPLNYAALSFESPFDRDTVESCVREILRSVAQGVAAKRNVELCFAGIGRLQVRDGRVKMRFYKDFINQMDGSGDLLSTMQNRAGTVDSVMSNRPFSRPGTSNTIVLPKIQPGMGTATGPNALPPVVEVDENQNAQHCPMEPIVDISINPEIVQHVPDRPDETFEPPAQVETEQHIASSAIRVDAFAENNEVGDITTENAMDNVLREAEAVNEPAEVYMPKTTMEEIHEERRVAPAGRTASRMAMPMAQASGISLLDDLMPSTPKHHPLPPAKGVTFNDFHPGAGLKPPTPPRLEPLQRSHSAEEMRARAGSACGHPNNAGQELCYLCHQRARRNVPVSFTAERNRREEEEDRLLQQYQTMRDAEDILREQERHISRRHDLQKISSFNLGVSEAVTAKKRAKDTDPQRSYIFQRRPLTPSRLPKQEEYLHDLTKQVHSKDIVKAKKKDEDQFLERLEQVQLAEDLAAQREQYIKDKEDSVTTYKRALDAQLRFKPVPIPPREADNEIFGKNDTTNETIAERRRRAHVLFQEQQELVGQRKREAILRRLSEQDREQIVLEKTTEGIMEDRAFRHKARVENRQRLENEWRVAAEIKRGHDLDERLMALESGNLLHEQCDKYKHCSQCKRRPDNCGESNIWHESYYIPGSRIMV